MHRRYFICSIRFIHQNLYLIWFNTDESGANAYDGLYMDEQGRLIAFSTKQEAFEFGKQVGINIIDENSDCPLNLDLVENWLKAPAIKHIDCEHFLNAWNLVWDLKSTINRRNMDGVDKRYLRVYNKLFWGNNLPSLTPPGRHWSPHWRRTDVQDLRASLQPGLELFRSRMVVYGQ